MHDFWHLYVNRPAYQQTMHLTKDLQRNSNDQCLLHCCTRKCLIAHGCKRWCSLRVGHIASGCGSCLFGNLESRVAGGPMLSSRDALCDKNMFATGRCVTLLVLCCSIQFEQQHSMQLARTFAQGVPETCCLDKLASARPKVCAISKPLFAALIAP